MDIVALPPKPDPHDGRPRPPHAPVQVRNTKPANRLERGEHKVPQPPAGEGPVLEWFYPDRTTRLIAGLLLPLLGATLYTLQDGGFGWTSSPLLWIILLPWPFVVFWLGRYRLSAGADWLAYNKSFVKTYELVSVKVILNHTAPTLEVKDSHGNNVHVQINRLQQNPDLWDLVYNGLLHSVHVGKAEVNERAREYLQLDFPPTLEHPRTD
jgi:hypothetical protein